MISLPGSPATSLLRVLFLGLTTLASPSRAQLEVHLSASLTKLRAVEGAEVVLPAWYSLHGEPSPTKPKSWEAPTVMWFFLEGKDKNMSQVLAHIGQVTTGEPRASLVHSMPSRNVSLRLRDLQEKDSGSYLCFVNLQDSQGTVKGQSSKHLELDVLVPPAPPSCHLRGVAHVGTNVTLSCKSPRSKPTAQYQWVRSPPSSQVFFAPVLDAIHGSLSLKNLSTSMSGVYVCKAHNEVGSAQCNVTLTVSTGPRATVVAGAVVGTMVGLGLLAGLVLLYQRRGKALEEPANDIKFGHPWHRGLRLEGGRLPDLWSSTLTFLYYGKTEPQLKPKFPGSRRRGSGPGIRKPSHPWLSLSLQWDAAEIATTASPPTPRPGGDHQSTSPPGPLGLYPTPPNLILHFPLQLLALI
ncbi:endothelial cell-selective adhesion molecule isoform X1 [Moschus berezovskii]|uniref:endothelial cell-selective adhesion molecule isoform X1 n=1 Tax=Moschus berezovskii TaxID=68408 RepID=UPI0024452135|nr:endothelial cell-selective adhesion molecule isoform X1 [Moschus berezovskii]